MSCDSVDGGQAGYWSDDDESESPLQLRPTSSRAGASPCTVSVREGAKSTILGAIALILFSSLGFSWSETVHHQITRAAVQSLPANMQQRLGSATEKLIHVYCLYPDVHDDPASGAQEREAVRLYCEKPDGKYIHDVTWQRQDDLESLQFLLKRMSDNLREGKTIEATQYAGVLAHFLEDSTCPAHALKPIDGQLNLMGDLLPPPPEKANIQLHTAIEASADPFDLGTRAPQVAGKSVAEAATNLLDRCYHFIRYNRAHLVEIVRAVDADEAVTLNKYRLKAEVAGAELLADACFTAFALAREVSHPPASSNQHHHVVTLR